MKENNIPIKAKKVKNLHFIVEVVKKKFSCGNETYVRSKLEKLGIKVKRTGKLKGFPDFVCEFNRKKFFVEVKGFNDGLRFSQLQWIVNHPRSLVYIYYLKKGWKNYYEYL